MIDTAFCIARVGEPVNDADGHYINFIDTKLQTVDAVVEFLHATYDRFATLLSDENADRPDHERVDLAQIGGFGVQLTNRFGGEIEIGLGRHSCLLVRLTPQPTRIYRNPLQSEGRLVFYLDGWHYTEMNATELVPRADCLNRLRSWLENDEFPDPT
jgi:hypothetical protein